MTVHFIWIGNNEVVPQPYVLNYQKCARLNSNFNCLVWKNKDCLQLLEHYNLVEQWSKLTFINKCNFLKYLILDKFGGIYTDFDITWKVRFQKIMYDFGFPQKDIILTSVSNSYVYESGIGPLMDDPFIISKPNMFKDCIEYCLNRTDLKNDGEHYHKTKELIPHKLEPVGPFGLTEWLIKKQINFANFPQETLLDSNGHFGIHAQKMNWK